MKWLVLGGLAMWLFGRRRAPTEQAPYGPEYRPDELWPGVDDSYTQGAPYSPCPCPNGFTPVVGQDGDCACIPVSVEVIPNW